MTKLTIIKSSDTPLCDFGNGLILKILLDSQAGAKHLDLGTVKIPPHKSTPMHVRTFDEAIYMLRGRGVTKLESGEEYVLETSDCILIPAGTMHAHANDSGEELEQLYIFAPQAPTETENILRNLPTLN